MAIVSNLKRSKNAKAFYDIEEIWLGIGKQTAWSNGDTVPAEDADQQSVLEPLGYAKVTNKYPVVPDDNGTLIFKNAKFSIVSEENFLSSLVKHVYVEFTLLYDQFPLGTYRQCAVFDDMIRMQGVSANAVYLTPSQVSSTGDLLYLENNGPTSRDENLKDTIALVIVF